MLLFEPQSPHQPLGHSVNVYDTEAKQRVGVILYQPAQSMQYAVYVGNQLACRSQSMRDASEDFKYFHAKGSR